MKRYQLTAGILAVLCMLMIFAFSAQPSDDSGEVSDAVSVQLINAANKWFHWDLDYEKIREAAEKIEPAVRKTAHAAEYGLLAVCLFLFFDCCFRSLFWHVAAAVAASSLYAVSDEIHQLFVPGRFGCAKDVLIDSAGAVIAVLCVTGARKCTSFLWKKSKYAEEGSSSGEMM